MSKFVSDLITESRWSSDGVVAVALLTVAALFVAVLILRKSARLKRRLPPGPRGWPILGSLPLLGALPNQSLSELAKTYGPIMFLSLGSVKTLVVSSPKMAEAVLKTQDHVMACRPVLISAKEIHYNAIDIAWSPAEAHWRYMRKIVTSGLLTSSRINQFREIREQEVGAILHFILGESKRGNPVNLTECFGNITVNNITQMMMNKSYCVPQSLGSDSPPVPEKSTVLPEYIREAFEVLGTFNIADYVPLLKPFDPQGLQRRAKVVHRGLDSFLQAMIDEHRERSSTTDDYKEDFVDALLGYGQTQEFEQTLSMDMVKAMLLDMLSGAGDTSSATALWTFTELMRHPHVMKKLQDELDSVVGKERLVQDLDLPQLPYLTCVMKESMRLHPAGSILLPHESTEDCKIEGYHIPAGTRIHVNTWHIQRDPSIYENPLEFNPDRFLNSPIDYKGQGQDFVLLPFGSGRRRCPGINLGTLMVLYPLAVLLHALDWTFPPGENAETLDMSETFGLVLYKTIPLKVCGKPRLAHHVLYPVKK